MSSPIRRARRRRGRRSGERNGRKRSWRRTSRRRSIARRQLCGRRPRCRFPATGSDCPRRTLFIPGAAWIDFERATPVGPAKDESAVAERNSSTSSAAGLASRDGFQTRTSAIASRLTKTMNDPAAIKNKIKTEPRPGSTVLLAICGRAAASKAWAGLSPASQRARARRARRHESRRWRARPPKQPARRGPR